MESTTKATMESTTKATMESTTKATMEEQNKTNIELLVKNITNDFTTVLSIDEIKNHSELHWGGNGVGDRWGKKKFNYSVIYSNKKIKKYSENDDDEIPVDLLTSFFEKKNIRSGIIGIFVHSLRKNIISRYIRPDILKEIHKLSCVICGTNTEICCDHKNDIYNDDRVLDKETQNISDFQPLCNHCNLQKRQVFKDETKLNKIYSAKKLKRFQIYPFEFPWEKKIFDLKDITTKKDTYWYDPVEFEQKIYLYATITIPIIKEIKLKIKVSL